MYLSIYLSIYVSIYLSIYLSMTIVANFSIIFNLLAWALRKCKRDLKSSVVQPLDTFHQAFTNFTRLRLRCCCFCHRIPGGWGMAQPHWPSGLLYGMTMNDLYVQARCYNQVHTVSFYIILCHTTKLCPLLFASLFYTLTFRRGVAFLVVSSLLSTKPDELKQTIQQVPTSISQATLRQSVGTSYLFKMAKPSASWD